MNTNKQHSNSKREHPSEDMMDASKCTTHLLEQLGILVDDISPEDKSKANNIAEGGQQPPLSTNGETAKNSPPVHSRPDADHQQILDLLVQVGIPDTSSREENFVPPPTTTTLGRCFPIRPTPCPGAFPSGGFSSEENDSTIELSAVDDASQLQPNDDLDSCLVEARAIQEEPVDLEVARPVPLRQDLKVPNNGCRMKVAMSLIVVLCLAFLIIGVRAAARKKEKEGAEVPAHIFNVTQRDGTVHEEYHALLEMLPQEYWLAITSDQESPQHKAFQWLLQDPYSDSYSKKRLLQRFVLVVLYYATKGDQWIDRKNWLSYEVNECEWEGQSQSFFSFGEEEVAESPCSPENSSTYERLWITNNNLDGTIPDEIYALTSLTSISFWKNGNLTAKISPRIQHLQQLVKFNVVKTNVRGAIPSELGLLSQLKIFYGGDHSGTLPTDIAKLESLEQFVHGRGRLQGPIPTEFGFLTNLNMLGLREAHLTGVIPTELAQMTK
jgi:hypothetical protein